MHRQWQAAYGEHAAENVKGELCHAAALVSIVGGPSQRTFQVDRDCRAKLHGYLYEVSIEGAARCSNTDSY